MLRMIKNRIIMLVAALTLAVPVVVPVATTAACNNNIGSSVSRGISDTGNNQGASCTGTDITSGIGPIAKKVVNLFSIIVGVISVIMIIYAGFRYVTSGGESNSVSNAKNTLVYAIVGLIIVVLAQLIVRYVLNTANTVANPNGG